MGKIFISIEKIIIIILVFFVLISDEIMFVFGEPLNATDSKLYKYEEIQLARRIMGLLVKFCQIWVRKTKLFCFIEK